MRLRKVALCLLPALLPVAVYSFSRNPPPVQRTGAPADGGLNCTACHRTTGAANSDSRGRLTILAVNYKPGEKQTIRLVLEHPEATKWGFQLTARLASDESRPAGTFTPTSAISVRCADNTNAPCNGLPEFASHNSTSTFTDTRNRATWEVEWTAPPAQQGDVVFYAAGNAANNSGTNAGDYIYTTSLRVRADAACQLTQTPRVLGVRNAATFEENRISANSLISIGGSGFQAAGQQRAATGADITDNRFPTELGCIAVEIGGRPAPIFYLQENQINAQVPALGDLGNVQLRVIANPGRPNQLRSEPFTIRLSEFAPGLFRFLPGNSAAALIAGTAVPVGDPQVVPGARPVRRGEFVSLFATGLGFSDPVFQAGEIPAQAVPLRDPLTLIFNGVTLPASEIRYAGLAPGAISGLYQIDFRVPNTAAPGNNTVVLQMGGLSSPGGITLPVQE